MRESSQHATHEEADPLPLVVNHEEQRLREMAVNPGEISSPCLAEYTSLAKARLEFVETFHGLHCRDGQDEVEKVSDIGKWTSHPRTTDSEKDNDA